MKALTSLLVLFVISLSTVKSQTGLFVPSLAKFDTAIQDLMSTYNVPGGQLAITYKGKLVYNRGFGFADVANQDSVFPNNIFRIASVSKTITGLACMKLFEQNLLNLDGKVFGNNGILNDNIYTNILDERVKNITVRMLLQHSAGWNRDLSGDPMFNAYYIANIMGVSSPPSAQKVIEYMLKHKMLDFTPGTQYQYSNFGYCVLGRVIEKVSGQSYYNYVNNNILLPLGINYMNTGKNLFNNKLTNEVNYYDYPGAPLAYSIYNNTSRVPWPYGGFNMEFLDAGGGWVASAEDLLKIVCSFDKKNSRPDMISIATIDTMIKPSKNNVNYACGISVNQYNNWWHMGSLPGTTAEIIRYGNADINWAILFNTRDQNLNINAATDNLVWNVLPQIKSWPTFDLFNQNTNVSTNKIEFKIYPNPANNFLNIEINNNILSIELINSMGESVFEQKNNFDNKISISLSNFENGIYLLKLTDLNKNIQLKKIIIMH